MHLNADLLSPSTSCALVCRRHAEHVVASRLTTLEATGGESRTVHGDFSLDVNALSGLAYELG